MKKMNLKSHYLSVAILIAAMMIFGCASSDEASMEKEEPKQPAQPSATEMMQKEMASLKEENSSLKDQLSKMEQDNRAATARAAEMETQLAEVKEHLTSAPPSPPPAVRSISSNRRDSYDEALNLFRSRKYGDAASMLEGVLESGSAGDLESNCHYWLGECSYAMKNYSGALDHLQKVFGYSKTSKKDDAQLMIANCYFAMGDKARAKAEYQKLIDKYPASPYVKRAKGRIDQL